MSDGLLRRLELKLPPVLVVALIWFAMAALRDQAPRFEGATWSFLSGALIGLAGVIAVAGVVEFRRAGTTVDPTRPDRAQQLVERGIFRISRNPMYLGMVLATLGIALALGSLWCMVGPPVLAAWLQRFQILPEERALTDGFGAEYSAYRRRVARWIGRRGP